MSSVRGFPIMECEVSRDMCSQDFVVEVFWNNVFQYLTPVISSSTIFSCACVVLQVLLALGWWFSHLYIPRLCGLLLPDTDPWGHYRRLVAWKVQVSLGHRRIFPHKHFLILYPLTHQISSSYRTIIYLSIVYAVGQCVMAVSAIHDITDANRDGTPDNMTLHVWVSLLYVLSGFLFFSDNIVKVHTIYLTPDQTQISVSIGTFFYLWYSLQMLFFLTRYVPPPFEYILNKRNTNRIKFPYIRKRCS